MSRPTNQMRFCLTEEADPFKRLGMHGLYRLLKHGEGDEHFPDIEQSDSLQWEIDEDANTVTLWWETVDDLNRLLGCQVGDFRYGIAINPGYETNPKADGFYLTARFHQGTVGTYFFAMSGARRSESLSGSTAAKKALNKAHAEQHGPPVTELNHMGGSGKDSVVKMTVSPHTRSDKMLALKEGKRGLGTMQFTTVIHPSLSAWNNTRVTAPAEDVFLVSFACLSYIYTNCADGMVGLGLDAPSFRQADRLHRRWAWKIQSQDVRSTITVPGDARSALWVMASNLDLHGTYHGLTSKGSTWFNTEILGGGTSRLYEMIRGVEKPRSECGRLRSYQSIPVKTNNKGETYVSLLDQLVFNLEHHVPWFSGLDAACVALQYDGSYGLTPWGRDTLTNLFHKDSTMTPTQKSIARKMRSHYVSLASNYAGESPWDRTHRFVIRQHLNHAVNAGRILQSVQAIRDEVLNVFSPSEKYKTPPAFLTESEFEYLYDWSKKSTDEVRAFLAISCMVSKDKTLTP